jgi:hypothetical protein
VRVAGRFRYCRALAKHWVGHITTAYARGSSSRASRRPTTLDLPPRRMDAKAQEEVSEKWRSTRWPAPDGAAGPGS